MTTPKAVSILCRAVGNLEASHKIKLSMGYEATAKLDLEIAHQLRELAECIADGGFAK